MKKWMNMYYNMYWNTKFSPYLGQMPGHVHAKMQHAYRENKFTLGEAKL